MDSWLELTCFHRVTLAAVENGFEWDRKRDTLLEALRWVVRLGWIRGLF